MPTIQLKKLSLKPLDIELPLIVESLSSTGLPPKLTNGLKNLFSEIELSDQSKLFDFLMGCHYPQGHPEYNVVKLGAKNFNTALMSTIAQFKEDTPNLCGIEIVNIIKNSLLNTLQNNFSHQIKTQAFQHTVFSMAIQNAFDEPESIFKRLIGEVYDDEVELLEDYGSVLVEFNSVTKEASALFVLIEGYTTNTHLEYAHDSMAKAFGYLESIQTNFGKATLLKFYEKITYSETREEFYYTAESSSSKGFDILLQKHFGVNRLIQLAQSVFGAGWESSILGHAENKKYNLINKNEIMLMKDLAIPTLQHVQVIEHICFQHLNHLKNISFKPMPI